MTHPHGERHRVALRDLLVEACVGVSVRERRRPQTLTMNIDVVCDARQSGIDDELHETVDYSQLARFVRHSVAQHGDVGLLETLGDRVSQAILDKFDRASLVRIAVRKPDVIPRCGGAEVEVIARKSTAGDIQHGFIGS